MAAHQKLRMKLDDFEVKDIISRGSFGVVYRAARKTDGRVFALKQVSLHGMKKLEREEAIDEVSHPYIIRHFDSFIDEDQKLNIVMEYAPNGNLNILVKASKNKGLPNDLIWKYFIQALVGLRYLHGKKIIHRDFKTLNLFLDSNDNIKIGDLGIARALSDNTDFAQTIVGTPYYLSPELCEDKPYNEKSDVWALGIVLYELCMGGFPFTAQNEGALIRKIMRGQYVPVNNRPPELKQMVELCMTFDYTKRPDTIKLLSLPIIKQKAQQLAIDLDPPPISTPVGDPVPIGPAAAQPLGQHKVPSAEEMMNFIEANAVPQYAGDRHSGRQAGPQLYPQQQASSHSNARQRQGVPAAHHQPPGYDPHPFALANQPGMQPVPTLEMQNMQIGGGDPRHSPRQHPAQGNQLKDVMGGYVATDPARHPQRARPEELPAAGGRQERPASARAPFAQSAAVASGSSYRSKEHEEQLWNAAYTSPQFGRKRNPDLAFTGPSLRGSGAMNSSNAAGKWAPAAADDSTSYATSYYQPTTAYR